LPILQSDSVLMFSQRQVTEPAPESGMRNHILRHKIYFNITFTPKPHTLTSQVWY